MRRLAPLLTLGVLAGCSLWGSSVPSAFEGWFHLDHAGRTVNLAFTDPNVLLIRDLGCDYVDNVDQEWASDGSDTLVAIQAPGAPRFTQDPDQPGGLLAQPGMFGSDPEHWLPGARCPVCPPGDAGVVTCDTPAVIDGGI